MKWVSLFLLSVFALKMEHVSGNHQNRFIVNIVELLPPHFNTSRFMCTGTVFSSKHVLTTAKCVENRNLRLNVREFTYTNNNIGGLTISNFFCKYSVKTIKTKLKQHSMSSDSVDRVFIHPDYKGLERENNVAVVKVISKTIQK
jgi:hypothetical protein